MSWENIISISFSKSNNPLVFVSKFLSVFGIAVGCFSIITALSIMNGFEKLIKDKIRGFEGDLRISGIFDENKLNDFEDILERSTFIERKAIMEFSDEFSVLTFKAINMNKFDKVYDISYNGDRLKNGEVMVGKDLALRLGLDIGDSIFINSPLDQTLGFGLPIKRKFIVGSIFSSNVIDYDNRYVFLTLFDGKKLFKRKLNGKSYDIRIDDDLAFDEIKNKLYSKLGQNIKIDSWEDLNKSLVDAMKLEKLGITIVLSLIFFVASFNLAMNLSLNSLQNLKEIALLRALGASKISIRKIVLYMGLKLSGIGICIGTLSSIIILFFQSIYKFIPIPDTVYFVSYLPVDLEFKNIFLTLILSLTFSSITSYILGSKISKISIIKILQWVK